MLPACGRVAQQHSCRESHARSGSVFFFSQLLANTNANSNTVAVHNWLAFRDPVLWEKLTTGFIGSFPPSPKNQQLKVTLSKSVNEKYTISHHGQLCECVY